MSFFILTLILLISTPSLSQTPNESIDQIWEVGDRRWTIEEERRFEKWGAGSSDSIDFIEKTYGKKDPEYADFLNRQQYLHLEAVASQEI
jgi:hypothetical protein